VVELDARIVAAARRALRAAANDARLAVEIGDGAAALVPECCDALIIDAFQDEQHVPQLASGEFYDGAFLALAEPGVMVVNFMDDDPQFDQALQRLERAFGGAVWRCPRSTTRTSGVRAEGGAGERRMVGARRRAERLESRLGCRSRAMCRACAR